MDALETSAEGANEWSCDAGTILHMVPAEKQTLAKITLSSGFFPPDAHEATFT